MSSEFERRLSVEELKQLNRPQTMPPQSAPMPPAYPPQWEWDELLVALNRLEASVGAQEALVRALTRQVGQLPTQGQLEALTRDVAQMRAELKQAGKKRERHFSLPRLRLPKLRLPDISWSSLLLGLTALALTGGVLWAVWFSWEKLWNMMHTLLP